MFKLSDFISAAQASAADKNYLSDEEALVPERIPIPPEIERMIRKAAEASLLWPDSDEHRAALEDFEANHFGLNAVAENSGQSLAEISNDPIFDRFGFFDQQPQGILAQAVRKGAFQNFVQPDIDARLARVREESLTHHFEISLPENVKWMILDDLIKTLDENGEDSAWLHELKSADFTLKLYGLKGEELNESEDSEDGDSVNPRGVTTVENDGSFASSMNAHKFSKYSPRMKSEILHELRHVWQHHQEFWKPKFGDGKNSLTDVDTEVDAYEKQFALEKILGVKATSLRNFFDFTDTNKSLTPAMRLHQKAKVLYDKLYGPKGTYRLKESFEYEQEAGK